MKTLQTPTRNDRLSAKCDARNRVHKELLARVPEMLDCLRPFIGQKVRNATGTIAEKVRKLLPETMHTVSLSFYYSASDYSFRVEFKTSEPILPCGCCYAEASYSLGDLQNGILVKVNNEPDPEFCRTNYTPEEITELRKELEEAENVTRTIESKLYHFGKYDQ